MTVCLPTCLPAYLPICLLAFLPTCLPAYLPTCLPACLHTCFPVCLSSSVFKEKIKEAAYPPTEGVYERSGSFRLTKVGVATITRVTRDKVMAVRWMNMSLIYTYFEMLLTLVIMVMSSEDVEYILFWYKLVHFIPTYFLHFSRRTPELPFLHAILSLRQKR